MMLFAATWMDLVIIILSESEKGKYHMIITHMWNIKYDINELIYKTETDSQTQKTNLWLPKGKRMGGGINQDFDINRHKLPYVK